MHELVLRMYYIGKHCHVKLDIIGQQSILEPKTPKTPKMTKQAHFDKYFSKKSKTHVPCIFWWGTQNWSWYEIEQREWKCKGRPSVQSPTNPAVWTVQALWCLTNVYTLDDKNSGLTPLTQALRDRDPWEQFMVDCAGPLKVKIRNEDELLSSRFIFSQW